MYNAKIAKCKTAQMKPYKFKSYDSISFMDLLKSFKLICDTNYVRKGATMWQFNFFTNQAASAVLNVCLSAESTTEKYSWSAQDKTR